MTHHFEVELAKQLGIEEAILIDKFVGWIQHNRANNKNYFDGRTWTFNSAKAYADIFPYMTESKIKRVVARLVELGILVKGNYNENQYDRTNWYAFTDEGNALVQNYYFHSSKMTNGKVQNERPIPNNQPIYQHNSFSFTPSDDGTDAGLFDDAEVSTITMLTEENIPYNAQNKNVTQEQVVEQFEDLWLMYERKGSKANAKKEFAKLTTEEVEAMRLHIPAYLQSRPERQYRQDFERYIKNKTFNSVVYSKQNEILYDPDAATISATQKQMPEFKPENESVTFNGTIYR
jgi:hypothetical protein